MTVQTAYDITDLEQQLITAFLEANGCGAETPKELLEDNFSCQSMQEINFLGRNLGWTKKKTAGVLSSLLVKGVIIFDEDPDEPNYWANVEYLETISEF